jgi:hypothetical protein
MTGARMDSQRKLFVPSDAGLLNVIASALNKTTHLTLTHNSRFESWRLHPYRLGLDAHSCKGLLQSLEKEHSKSTARLI